jgi:folate-binding protein YgfZ
MKIPKGAVTRAEWRAVDEGAAVYVRSAVARYRLTGSGRIACLQGLVTADVAKAPDGSRVFGALLTNKGMIVAPLWIDRLPDAVIVETPAAAGPLLADVFARSLPPRLCRWEDITGTTTGIGLYGPRAGAGVPPPATFLPAVVRGVRGVEGHVAREAARDLVDALAAQGAIRVGEALMESCRILAGIPAIGSEIDEKTLPQDARYEDLGAISYTKGCYLGQETVARVHFRGHPNRQLALLVLDAEPGDPPLDATQGGQSAGRLTSAAWSDELDAWAGLAMLRRDIADGANLAVGGTSGVVRVGRWLREA